MGIEILKREGYTEAFKLDKILSAVKHAFREVRPEVEEEVIKKLVEDLYVFKIVNSDKKEFTVEEIQDIVENFLMETGYNDVAKAYIIYRHQKALRRAVGWQMDELQKAIFEKKYSNNETFSDWLYRVSAGNRKLLKLIRDKKFTFAGRILAHRGIDKNVTYSNCYVIPAPEDNLESIFDTAKYLARTYSYGGGCGVDISKLRPKGAKVNNSAKETSGAVSFMDLYDLTTALIGQNGRRGALMISISDKHPDLPEFIDVKTKEGAVTKANISIRVSDDFMNAVKYGREWEMEFVTETGEVIKRKEDARTLFKKIAKNNWDWAEPGMLFWDRISKWHLMAGNPNHEFAGVNPCAEEPLMAGGSCLLGSINLSEFVKHPFTKKATFDFEKFKNTVKTAVVALNEVLDEGIKKHPLKIQQENAYLWRQIGLGVMGIADMLIKMGIRYGSPEALELSEKIARTMLNSAVYQSAMLAKEKGTFPMYEYFYLKQSEFYQQNIDDDVKQVVEKYGLRNSQLLTIAPTGSISTMWGISGGIEPIYSISYRRKTESLYGEDVYFEVFTPIIRELMTALNIKDKKDLPDYVVTTHDLHYKERIDMQAVWQKYIDASISSTVNLPKETTVQDVEELYMYAWEKGLKGVTVFRDGCKRTGILSKEEEEMNLSYGSDDKYVTCKECGSPIKVITNGCSICQNCGASACE